MCRLEKHLANATLSFIPSLFSQYESCRFSLGSTGSIIVASARTPCDHGNPRVLADSVWSVFLFDCILPYHSLPDYADAAFRSN